MLTVDCGITAVAEVDEAKALGLEVVVTDHHRPGDELPDCPIVATRPSSYPFPELCGTGVVYKLGEALLGADHPALRKSLDLVALATIADVVPLVDENRGLAAAGLRALACTRRPGLQALMRGARVDPAAVDSGSVAFRLAPRINAAGRLGRPDVALELILTEDADEAQRLAQTLEELNRDRQAVEDRILREAIAAVEALPERERRRRGYVLASEDWHVGVIGIVASRLAERFHRPIVLVTGSDDGWRGSGRSIPGFDLHGALAACSEHLVRFGGHRAAAGLSIDPACIPAFAEAFAAHADENLEEGDLHPVTSRRRRGLGRGPHARARRGARAARAVRARQPRGHAARPRDAAGRAGDRRATGSTCGSGCARTAATRAPRSPSARDRSSTACARTGLFDIACRLQENHWNGTVAPQLVVRRLFDTPDGYEGLRTRLAELWRAGEDAWTPERAAHLRRARAEGGERPPTPAARVGDVQRPPRARDGGVAAGGVTRTDYARGTNASRIATASRRASRRRIQRRTETIIASSSARYARPSLRRNRGRKGLAVH